MTSPPASNNRVTVDGKFFRLDGRKFHVKGVTYGPFAENENDEPFPAPERVRQDFGQIRNLGANVLRVYHVPPVWFLEAARSHDLKLMVDIPWNKHICFADDSRKREAAIEAVRKAAKSCASHPAVMAICVANEIPADIVRWTGAAAINDFIEELVEVVKAVDPEVLCTFASFPPTEFLQPQNIDFHCFNVYLHERHPYGNYLGRLQMKSDTKPLLLGECGIDSIREGEGRKCEILAWQIEEAFRAGLAGTVIFSYTDDWVKAGGRVEDWAFGLTTREREPKESFGVVKDAFHAAPYFQLDYYPKVSVVIASYNAEATLKTCLDSLENLNYPFYEIVLVDDGSTDSTPKIVAEHSGIRSIRYEKNQGLSFARNTGIEAAEGEVVAFTDADCRADEDWLYYLIGDLINSRFAGIGGHNLLPCDDSWVASAVMVSPGGPAHVMLTDRLAEHIPGCNMAFYKWALEEVNGFDPIYRRAGDDVDICWRLQQRGYKIGFSPSGFVWHYRRSTVRAYLRQQAGYGEAEALLVRKHPEYFNPIGGSLWRGRIYTAAKPGILTSPPMIYHGLFGTALFQTMYQPQTSMMLAFLTSLEYYLMVLIPLIVFGLLNPNLLPLTLAAGAFPLILCVAAAYQADIPRGQRRFLSRPLVGLLFLLQPVVRGSARYRGRLQLDQLPLSAHETLGSLDRNLRDADLEQLRYWGDYRLTREEFLGRVFHGLERQEWHYKTDAGWSPFDVEIYGSKWCNLRVTTVGEAHRSGKQLLRCRLHTGWSLLAKLAFCSLIGVELVAVAMMEMSPLVLALLLAVLFLFAWFLREQERTLQRIIALFLDAVAKEQGFIKLEKEPGTGKRGKSDEAK